MPAVHRLVNLFQHGGRELDIYNNLRQVRLRTWEPGFLGLRGEGAEGSDFQVLGEEGLLNLGEEVLQISGSCGSQDLGKFGGRQDQDTGQGTGPSRSVFSRHHYTWL